MWAYLVYNTLQFLPFHNMWWLAMSCSQWVTRAVASNSVLISPLVPAPLRVNLITLLIVRNQVHKAGSYLQLKKQFWIKIVMGLKNHHAVLLRIYKAQVAAALMIVLCPPHMSRVDLKAKEHGRNVTRGLLWFSGSAIVPARATIGSYFHMLSSSFSFPVPPAAVTCAMC